MKKWNGFGLLVLVACACTAPTSVTMRSMIPVLEEMEAAINSSSDLQTVREGLPSGMLLVEGVSRRLPENKRVRLLATKLYSGFAMAFFEDGDPERARKLYIKARNHGLAGLPNGQIIVGSSFAEAEAAINRINKLDVPLLFWTASAWAGAVRLAIDEPRNQAALARVETMMKRTIVLDDTFYYGGPHLFRGVLLGTKPPLAGGDPRLALEEMETAFEMSGNHSLLCLFYRADLLAALPGREDEAKELLEMILDDVDRHPEELTFINTVAAVKAERLLAKLIEEETWLLD